MKDFQKKKKKKLHLNSLESKTGQEIFHSAIKKLFFLKLVNTPLKKFKTVLKFSPKDKIYALTLTLKIHFQSKLYTYLSSMAWKSTYFYLNCPLLIAFIAFNT